MFDWIPILDYTPVYYVSMLGICVLMIWILLNQENHKISILFQNFIGFVFLGWVILYLGLRPVSYVFADMATYAQYFHRIAAGEELIIKKDYIFNYFLGWSARVMSDRNFFFLCGLLYTIPFYVFSRKYCGIYWPYVFFIFVASYMFWPFGTNGIRNGIGTSLFIFSLCFYNRKYILYPIMILAFGMHSSVAITIAAFILSGLYRKPKVYLYLWLVAIPLSLAGGGFWENLFGNIGFGDDSRAEDYLTKGNTQGDVFAYTGFRWDFLFYSSFAVFAGWYFIFKKNITDKFYIHLWGTYMIANAFWILVIRANFSNRFAYLSWFLMAPVIAYPLLRYKLFPNQYRVIGGVIALYYGFTFFMFLKG